LSWGHLLAFDSIHPEELPVQLGPAMQYAFQKKINRKELKQSRQKNVMIQKLNFPGSVPPGGNGILALMVSTRVRVSFPLGRRGNTPSEISPRGGNLFPPGKHFQESFCNSPSKAILD
jgi:hypothetical protein